MLKRLYGRVLSKSPQRLRGRILKAAFILAGKPTVGLRPPETFSWPQGRKGCAVFSADFELAWAWRFAKGTAFDWRGRVAEGRKTVADLLDLFDSKGIPATWATVGHLFLRSCSREGGKAHPEMPRIPAFENRVWRFDRGDWYDHDPCSDERSDPAWYAPDLVRRILEGSAGHELACHTFSHVDMTDALCPPEVAEAEVARCVELAASEGANLRSFVFPGGTHGNFAALRRHGFITYRLRGGEDLAFPHLDPFGLVVLPSSEGLGERQAGWGARDHLGRIVRFLDRAARTGTVCHFWFHPEMDRWYLGEVFPEILEAVRERAEGGDLWPATMGDCARHCLPWLGGRGG